MSDDLRAFLAKATSRITSLDEIDQERRDRHDAAADRWGLPALRGRLVELSARGAAATLTMAVELVVEAQTSGEPVAWIALTSGTFYPPDVAASGVDLSALVVVRTPDPLACVRAAERVLRSGAFGLIVIDYAQSRPELSTASQGRLVTLAQSHDAAVVCLTEKSNESSSLGSLVSLRVEALRARSRDGDFDVTMRAIKDKRRGPGWTRANKRRGPAGYG